MYIQLRNFPRPINNVFPLLAIDPGNMTGWAKFEAAITVENVTTLTVTTGQFGWPESGVKLWSWLSCFGSVVVEDFRLRPDIALAQTGSQFIAVKVIGVIELQRVLTQQSAPTFYQPTQTKAVTDVAIRQVLGLQKLPANHQRDALRVAVTHFLKLKRW